MAPIGDGHECGMVECLAEHEEDLCQRRRGSKLRGYLVIIKSRTLFCEHGSCHGKRLTSITITRISVCTICSDATSSTLHCSIISPLYCSNPQLFFAATLQLFTAATQLLQEHSMLQSAEPLP